MDAGPQQTRRAHVGLGANLGDPEGQIVGALRLLDSASAGAFSCRVVRWSSLWHTAPVGPQDQPPFVNAAVELEVAGTPLELLRRLLSIERELGRDRTRSERWGPRRIDLDLLLFGSLCFRNSELVLPHPRITERRFVLEPLAELESVGAAIVEPCSGKTMSCLLGELRSGAPESWREQACERAGPLVWKNSAEAPSGEG